MCREAASVDWGTIANAVSALGAVGAVVFAFLTVAETRAMRREERLARLPELVVELNACAAEGYRGSVVDLYVRGLVHCSRLTRGARATRVLVESYRPKGSGYHAATTLGGTPSLG